MGKVPRVDTSITQLEITLKEMLDIEATSVIGAGKLISKYKFRDAALRVMNVARYANKYFDSSKPWETVTSNPRQCATTINLCLQTIRSLAILFEPFIPQASLRMWKMLNLQETPSGAGWESAATLAIEAGHELGTPEILFTKIEDDIIAKHIAALPVPANAKTSPTNSKPVITIDDFKKLDLRTAKIVEAERVPKSEKLLKIQISLGTERRQVIAGIGQHYAPEQLVGRTVVVVANLAPAKLMGQESQGMILAASNDEGKLTIITASEQISEGSLVK